MADREYVDQFSDPTFRHLFNVFSEHPETEAIIKTASIDETENNARADSAFAWRERRLFPIDSPEQATLSRMYMTKQAGVPEDVVKTCDKALEIYGITLNLQEKTASVLEPPTDNYLLPDKKRFLVQSKEHVKMAEEALGINRFNLSTTERVQASVNLVKQADFLGVAPGVDTIRNAGLVMSDTRVLRDWVDARIEATREPVVKEAFEKLSNALAASPRLVGDREELVKVANVLEELDNAADIKHLYGIKLPDPVQSVFNTDKLADELLDVAGRQVPLETMLQIDPEVYRDVFGADLANEFIDGDVIDPEQLKVILPTVPLDLQKVLVSQLGV
jgi:hypothetical protein